MEEQNTLSDALDWFFAKTQTEKHNLKDKHFPNEYIAYDGQWGFHFTLAQIKQMYVKDCGNNDLQISQFLQ